MPELRLLKITNTSEVKQSKKQTCEISAPRARDESVLLAPVGWGHIAAGKDTEAIRREATRKVMNMGPMEQPPRLKPSAPESLSATVSHGVWDTSA